MSLQPSDDWRSTLLTARWRVHASDALPACERCGLCWQSLTAHEHVFAFVEERGALLLRTCESCAPALQVVPERRINPR